MTFSQNTERLAVEAAAKKYGQGSEFARAYPPQTIGIAQVAHASGIMIGRNSAKAELDAKLASQEEALRILAWEFRKKNECFCHAIYNKPCHTCRITAQVTSLLGFWPGDKAKGEQ